MPNNFTYNLNIPNGPDNPSNDQPLMEQNTNSINSWTNVDHIGYNTNGSGIHKQVTLVNESAPGLGDGNGVLYANIQNSNSWPIWQNALGSTVIMSTFTANITNGFCSLPGGMIMQWGQVPAAGTSGIVTFPVTFFSTPFSIQLTTQASVPANVAVVDSAFVVTTSNFHYLIPVGGATILFWMAIGRQI